MAASFLDRQSTVAPPGFNRFLVPPAALAVHLSIGQAYAFSTFNLPLTKLIGITASAPGDWSQKQLVWIFSIAIAVLGSSAAVFGRWVERVGPRKSMFTAALCFGGGFMVSAVGIHLHQLWLLYLGYGVLGGCGLGIGYISPVSTLIKWFPDRPGMATGMAIMGFGGGALIAAPLSILLMAHFKTATSNGVLETFVTMGVIYFMFMMIGVYAVRVPAADWKPAGWIAPAQPKPLVTTANVAVDMAWRTPQFWLLWVVLCMNVTAGIGVLGVASPMIQEIFSRPGVAGRRRGLRRTDQSVQHGRPILLGLHLRLHRTAQHLHGVLPARHPAVLHGADARPPGLDRPFRRGLLHHPVDVRRRLRHDPRLSARHVRHLPGRRHSRPAADRLVGCRSPGSGVDQLHSRLPDRTTACRRRRRIRSPCTSCAACC